jgi:alpha-mannosidase/mannosylglycerate hydrolase
MKKQEFSAHYISGTHWDREWYRPYQEYRILLVRLIDGLIELMETSNDFKYFQMDGQTCILEDYLEIRPENKDRLAKLIKDKKILIGPWYTMPDLFCPDGESLVRNLLLGQRISNEWGVAPMPVGFICDMFGHPSQMPQIFAGFGITDIVMGRGTNEFDTPMFFNWESPDGTKALTFKLQDKQGYGAFALPRAILEGADGVAADQVPNREQYLSELKEAEGNPKKKKEVKEKWGSIVLANYVNYETKRANAPVIAVMDTMDHIPPAADVAKYLQMIKEGCPEVSTAHSTLPAFFDEVRKLVKGLQSRKGELRDPSKEKCGYLYLIPNCVSARIRMKQANDAVASLLEHWAEPMLAFTRMTDEAKCKEFKPYLDIAWKYLVGCHAHDSICGCSIDQVHRDMMYRFDQALVMGKQIREQALAVLTADSADLAENENEFTVTLVNPLPFERDEICVFDIDLPTNYPTTFHEGFRTQDLKSFTIEDAEGKPIPYQRLGFIPEMNERSHLAKYCFVSDGNFTRYTVAAEIKLPACGFTSIKVKPAKMPVRPLKTLRTGPVSGENEFLCISIEKNGTLKILDKSNGEFYRDLLTFEDRSEIGDGWFHGHSLNDSRILSSASPAQVEVVHDGPEQVTFRTRITMSLPEKYDWNKQSPCENRKEFVIVNEISLARKSKAVKVKTVIENNVQDHQLQLLLPADIPEAENYFAHTAFDIVERRIAIDGKTANWQEMDIVEKPFQDIQALAGKKRGLAFISGGGLHEGGVRDDMRRTMQVTLLRAFRRTVGTEGEQDGLEQGRLEYKYALMPFPGKFNPIAVLQEASALQAGTITRQSGKRPSGHAPMSGKEKAVKSFMSQVRNTVLVTALKPAEQGTAIIVRLWNPTSKTQEEVIKFSQKIKSVETVRLSENCPDDKFAKLQGGQVKVVVPAIKIITVKIELASKK